MPVAGVPAAPRAAPDRRLSALAAYLVLAALIVLALARLATPPAPRTPEIARLKLAYGPNDFAGALALADDAVALGEERTAQRPQDWINQESYARALMGRARLTASFDDLAVAGAALARGKSEAIANSGPLLTDAVFNLTIHRTAPIARDLAMVERSAVPLDPGDRAEVVALRGDVAFYSGDYSGALARYRAATRIADGPGVAFRIALWRKKTGDFDGAAAGFARAARINQSRTPQFIANVYLQTGSVELERGDWSAAEALFRRADAAFPGYWLIEAHAAQMRALRGDLDGAARAYRAIVRRSGSPEVMDALAGLYRAQGNRAQSQAWAAKAGAIWAVRLRQLPEAAYAHALEHELVLGDPAVALDLARRNMAARPYGDSVTLLGWALLANNRAGDAREMLERLNRTAWRTSAQYVALAEADALLGDGARSTAARAEAERINPRSTDPAAALIWFGHH